MSPIRKTVLVTGATGAVGPNLVALLLREGYSVRTLNRQGSSSTCTLEGVDIRLGDITKEADVQSAMEGCSIVFHLAAKLHINKPSEQLRAEYEQINVRGTEIITQAAQKSHVERLLLFSTINVYDCTESTKHLNHSLSNILTEHSKVRPETLYGKSKLQAEKIALTTIRSDGQPLSTVLRLASVYGPKMKGNYLRLWQMVRRGFYPKIGDGQNRRTLIHEIDVARAALLAATSEQAAGQIYNVTDGDVYTLDQIVQAMAQAQNRSLFSIPIPLSLARAGARTLALAWSVREKRTPIGSWTVDKLVEDIAVSGIKIQQELGFKPRYTLLEGWQTLSK